MGSKVYMFHFEKPDGASLPDISAQGAIERWIDVRPDAGGLRLHVREWAGAGPPFVLLHGLASNARTWDGVAAELAAAGRRVIAVDQRGHGLSDKPAHGYDFPSVTGDLVRLLDVLALEAPILVGQSWGGNVVLAFAAAYPARARQLVFVDGGFLDLQMRPEASWEHVARDLRPPDLTGFARAALKKRIGAVHPDWTEAGVEATLANFETLPDGTVRPWLTLDRHMEILPRTVGPEAGHDLWAGHHSCAHRGRGGRKGPRMAGAQAPPGREGGAAATKRHPALFSPE